MFYTDTDSTQQRKQAHIMLDLLLQGKLSAVVGLLEVMLDPVALVVAHAPIEANRSPGRKQSLSLRPANG